MYFLVVVLLDSTVPVDNPGSPTSRGMTAFYHISIYDVNFSIRITAGGLPGLLNSQNRLITQCFHIVDLCSRQHGSTLFPVGIKQAHYLFIDHKGI